MRSIGYVAMLPGVAAVRSYAPWPLWRDSPDLAAVRFQAPEPECLRIDRVARLLRELRWRPPGGKYRVRALKDSDLDVLDCLRAHLNRRTGRCDPALATIAAETGWSVRTVQRALGRLRAYGIVAWRRRSYEDRTKAGDYCRRQASNAYALLPAPQWHGLPAHARLAAIAAARQITAPSPEPDTWGAAPAVEDGEVCVLGGRPDPQRARLVAAWQRIAVARGFDPKIVRETFYPFNG